MKCKCGYFPMDEYKMIRHECPECNHTEMENDECEPLTDYERAWSDLTKWLKEVQPFITVTIADVKLKMKEIIDEQK